MISSMFPTGEHNDIVCYFNAAMHARRKFAERSRLFSFKRSLRYEFFKSAKARVNSNLQRYLPFYRARYLHAEAGRESILSSLSLFFGFPIVW